MTTDSRQARPSTDAILDELREVRDPDEDDDEDEDEDDEGEVGEPAVV